MTISFSGLASGLDTTSWITSLTALKQAKVTVLQEEKQNVVLSKNTLNSIKSFFSSFRSVIERVTDTRFNVVSMDLFAQNIATSANLSVLTATATPEAQEGKYEIKVDKLASNTQAVSKYDYTTTIVDTTTATKDSLLKNLGVKSGNIEVTVDGKTYGLTITNSETIGSFTQKLKNMGVNAQFNEQTGIFSMDINASAINDKGNTGIVEGLHLKSVNQGYLSGALTTERLETVTKAADGSTKLKDLDVKAGTLTIKANDGEYEVTLEDDDTLQDLLDALRGENIDATLEDGVFSINNAIIVDDGDTGLMDAFGLTDPSVGSVTQKSEGLIHQSIHTTATSATLDTMLSEFDVPLYDGDTVIVKDAADTYTTINLSQDWTIGSLFEAMTSAGVEATLSNDGRVTITGGSIEGGTYDVKTALGLESETVAGLVTGRPLTEEIVTSELAKSDAKLVEDLGVKEGYFAVTTAEGTHYIGVNSGDTIQGLVDKLNVINGVTANYDETYGVFTITGGEYRTMTDAEAESIIGSGEKATDVLAKLFGADVIPDASTSISSTSTQSQQLKVNVTTTVNATLTTTLGKLGLQNGTTYAIFDVNGTDKAVEINSNTSIQGLIDVLAAQGITASFDETNATLTIENAVLKSAGTSLSSTESTQTVEMTATGETQLGQVIDFTGLDTEIKVYEANGVLKGTITATEGMTFDQLSTAFANLGVTATLSNGMLTLSSNDGSYSIGDVIAEMGMDNGTTTTVEKIQTQYSNPLLEYITVTVAATMSSKISACQDIVVAEKPYGTYTITGTIKSDGSIVGGGSVVAINSAEDFSYIKAGVASGNTYQGITFVLGADITLGSATIGVGNDTTAFKGTFDGAGHTITLPGFTFGDYTSGIFNVIDGATIKNLSVSGGVSFSTERSGLLVGEAKNSTIENVSIDIYATSSYDYFAGLVGVLRNSTVNNCHVVGTLRDSSGGNCDMAGVAAYVYGNSTIKNTQSSVTMSNGYGGTGLVTNVSDGNLTIENCLFDGSYSNNLARDVGFVNYITYGTTVQIKNSIVTGSFDANAQTTSIFARYNDGSLIIDNCISTASEFDAVTLDDGTLTDSTGGDPNYKLGVDTYSLLAEATHYGYDKSIWAFNTSGEEPEILTAGNKGTYAQQQNSIYVRLNGGLVLATINVDETTTIQELADDLSTWFDVAIDEDGKLSITSQRDLVYLEGEILERMGVTIQGPQFVLTTSTTGISMTSTEAVTIEDKTSKTKKSEYTQAQINAMTALSAVSSTSTISSGTYKISTTAELEKLATMTNSGYIGSGATFVLANDIDLSSCANWTPIGNSSTNSFTATFNGNGHTISNLTIAGATAEFQGLFGRVASATVKNLGVENVNVSLSSTSTVFNVGGVFGAVNSADGGTTKSQISNIWVTGTVTGYRTVGGLTGGCSGAIISNCSTNVTVKATYTGDNTGVGALVGRASSYFIITNCYAAGSATTAKDSCGGILGYMDGSSNTITSCYSSATLNGTNRIGGLVGKLVSGTVTNCYYSGTNNGTGSLVEDTIGENKGTTSNLYASAPSSTKLSSMFTTANGWTISGSTPTQSGLKSSATNTITYTVTTVSTMTSATTFAQLGLEKDTAYVIGYAGSPSYTYTVKTTDTVQSFMTKLNQLGVTSCNLTDGVLKLTPQFGGNSYFVDDNGILDLFNITGEQYSTTADWEESGASATLTTSSLSVPAQSTTFATTETSSSIWLGYDDIYIYDKNDNLVETVYPSDFSTIGEIFEYLTDEYGITCSLTADGMLSFVGDYKVEIEDCVESDNIPTYSTVQQEVFTGMPMVKSGVLNYDKEIVSTQLTTSGASNLSNVLSLTTTVTQRYTSSGEIRSVSGQFAATGNNTLGEVFDALGTESMVANGYTLYADGQQLYVGENTTIDQLVAQLNSLVGVTATYDSNGLYVENAVLSGTVADALGITVKSGTQGVIKEVTANATLDTTMEQLGVADKNWVIRNSAGERVDSANVAETTTLKKLFDYWAGYGINATIENGVITIENTNGYYLEGTLAEAFGIGKVYGPAISMSTSDVLTYNGNQIVTLDTKLGEFLDCSDGVVEERNYYVDSVYTYDLNKEAQNFYGKNLEDITVEQFIELCSDGDYLDFINLSLKQDGTITVGQKASYNYVTGSIFEQMGITVQYGEVKSCGLAVTATIQATATIYTYATENTTFEELGIDESMLWYSMDSQGVANNVTASFTADQTLGDLVQSLKDRGYNATLTSTGTLKITGNTYASALCGSLMTQLGIVATAKATQVVDGTTTIGKAATSTVAITCTMREVATEDATLLELAKAIGYTKTAVPTFTATIAPDGTVVGTGTIIAIDSAETLAAMNGKSYTGYKFIITADIDLQSALGAKDWTGPTLTSCTVDGTGHTINMDGVTFKAGNSGLISRLAGGTVQNLKTEGSISVATTSSATYKYIGGVVGYSVGGTIQNIVSDINVYAKHGDGYLYLGGVVGYATDTTKISKTEFTGTIGGYTPGSPIIIGGIVSCLANSNISDSIVKGTFTGSSGSNYSLGAIVGTTSGTSSISNVLNDSQYHVAAYGVAQSLSAETALSGIIVRYSGANSGAGSMTTKQSEAVFIVSSTASFKSTAKSLGWSDTNWNLDGYTPTLNRAIGSSSTSECIDVYDKTGNLIDRVQWEADESISDLVSKLQASGLEVDYADGILSVEGGYIVNKVAEEIFGLKNVYSNSAYSMTAEGKAEQYGTEVGNITLDTKMGDFAPAVGLTIVDEILGDGITYTIDPNKTIDEMFNKDLAEYLHADVVDGKITLTMKGNYCFAPWSGPNKMFLGRLGIAYDDAYTVLTDGTSDYYNYSMSSSATLKAETGVKLSADVLLGGAKLSDIDSTYTGEDIYINGTLAFSTTADMSILNFATRVNQAGGSISFANRFVNGQSIWGCALNRDTDSYVNDAQAFRLLGLDIDGSNKFDYTVTTNNTTSGTLRLSETATLTVNECTTLAELGADNTSWSIVDSDGNEIASQSGVTGSLHDIFEEWATYGLYATIDDGKIHVTSQDGKKLSGTMITKLGLSQIGAPSYTVATQETITYTVYDAVTWDTKLSEILDLSDDNFSIAGTSLYISDVAYFVGKDEVDITLKDLDIFANDYLSIDFDLEDGKLSCDALVEGSIFDQMGMTPYVEEVVDETVQKSLHSSSAVTYTGRTITVGTTQTSTAKVTTTAGATASTSNTFANCGFSSTYYFTVTSQGTVYTFSATGTTTFSSFFSTLRNYGFSCSMTNGTVTITGTDDVYFGKAGSSHDFNDSLDGELFKFKDQYNNSGGTAFNGGQYTTRVETITVTGTTTLDKLGFSNGVMTIFDGTENKSFTLTGDTTVNGLINILKSNGINASISSGRLTISAGSEGNNARIIDDGGVLDALKITSNTFAKELDYTVYQNSTSDFLSTSRVETATENTTFGELGLEGEGYVTVFDGATEVVLTYTSTDTIGDLVQNLDDINSAFFANGKLVFEGNDVVNIRGFSSNLEKVLDLDYVAPTQGKRVQEAMQSSVQITGTFTATLGTKLADLGVTDFTIQIDDPAYDNYNEASWVLSSDATIQDLLNFLNEKASSRAMGTASFSNGVISFSQGHNCYEWSGGIAEALGFDGYTVADPDVEGDDYKNNSTPILYTTVMTEGTTFAQLGLPTTSSIYIREYNANGSFSVVKTLNVYQSTTVGEVIDMLNEEGFAARLENERFYVEGSIDGRVLAIDSIAYALKLKTLYTETLNVDYTNTDSNRLVCQTITTVATSSSEPLSVYDYMNVSTNTELAELADENGCLDITSGKIVAVQNGIRNTILIDNTDNISTLAGKLDDYGITVDLSGGKLSFVGDGNTYLTTSGLSSAEASNILEKLDINDWNTRYDSTSKPLLVDADANNTINGSTKLVDLKDASGNSLGITTGEFTIISNGYEVKESIDANTTVNDLISTLSLYGIAATLSNDGVISLRSQSGSYLKESSGAAGESNIVEKLFSDWEFTKTYKSNLVKVYDTQSVTASRTTKLSSLGEGEYQAGYITLEKADGEEIAIALASDETIGSFLNKLSAYGFTTSIDSNGYITIESSDGSILKNYTGAGQASNILDILAITQEDWEGSEVYKITTINLYSTETLDVALTRDSKLSELGVTSGEYYIYNNGVKYTGLISYDETAGSFLDTLAMFGIQASIVNDGESSYIELVGTGDTYLATSASATNASNIVDVLFPTAKKLTYNYDSSLSIQGTATVNEAITEETLLSEFDTAWGGSTLKSEGNISVTNNGVTNILYISSDETVGSLMEKFSEIGVCATLQNGQIMLSSNSDDFAINSAGTTSSIVSNLGFVYDDEFEDFASSTAVVQQSITTIEQRTGSVSNFANNDTKLSLLNISGGTLSVYRNGQKATVNVDSEETFAQLRQRLLAAFSEGDVDLVFEDGYMKICSTTAGVKVEAGSTTDTSNLAAIAGLSPDGNGVKSSRELYCVNGDSKLTTTGLFKIGDIKEGTFTIGNATFEITDSTTLNNLISQINASTEANATAYWDSIDGKFVIKSRQTGSSLVNIEAGTSNFTDIMGFTSTVYDADGNVIESKLNVASQELGENAKFSINGTQFTSTSNTIGSDISRIKGVTIDLKGISNGQTVTLEIKKDTESLANAMSEIVDSYNELMTNVEKEIAKDGKLSDQSTLRMIKNQIRNLMTSSVVGASPFANLAAIGITTEAASASNISTANINKLVFDKTKFNEAYNADAGALKNLLVGSNGVLTQLEKVVESSLTSASGYFSSAENSYNNQISRLDNQIKRANEAVERYRARLEAKFQSMDMLISQMQNQYSSFLGL